MASSALCPSSDLMEGAGYLRILQAEVVLQNQSDQMQYVPYV